MPPATCEGENYDKHSKFCCVSLFIRCCAYLREQEQIRLKTVDICFFMKCHGIVLYQGRRVHLFISKNAYFLWGMTTISSSELFGKSTPPMSSVVKLMCQCYFQYWRGAVGFKLHKSICPLQRMRCLQGLRRLVIQQKVQLFCRTSLAFLCQDK